MTKHFACAHRGTNTVIPSAARNLSLFRVTYNLRLTTYNRSP